MDLCGIGNTPVVPLADITKVGRVWLKAEYANPFGSVKDRTAAYLLAWARTAGGPDVSIVESTSGNLGLALAHLGPRIGIPATLVMDASVPIERIDDVRRAGATVHVVTEPRAGLTFRESRIAVARELGDRSGWLWLNQYGNEAGMRAHEDTTAREIWTDLQGNVDAVVASVGTGGTLCGIAAALRDQSPRPLIVGVEPFGSTISGGVEGDYLPAGSGMRGAPKIVALHGNDIDFFARVPDQLAAAWTWHLASRYGLEVGLTTGAALVAGVILAEEREAKVIVIAPDHGHPFRSAIAAMARNCPARGDTSPVEWRRFGISNAPSSTLQLASAESEKGGIER